MNPGHWLGLSPQEASCELYRLIMELAFADKGYAIAADANIRLLVQRLYGDYRQVHMTNEYKRAEKQMRLIKSSPLWKALG
jgi:uncharacterized lipoprotein YajG